MSAFIIVDKKSLNEVSSEASNIQLKAPSIVHTKLYRDDVAEFIQEGNDLVLKLKNGKIIVISDFFVKKDDEESELIFEDEDCALPIWPFLLGAAGAAGAIAAVTNDDNDNGTNNDGNGQIDRPPSQVIVTVDKDGNITLKYPDDVDHNTIDKDKIIITDKDGNPVKDKDGKPLTGKDFIGPDADGNYTAKVPDDFEGEIKVEVPAGSYQDKDGNDGLASNGGNTTVDTTPPHVIVSVDPDGTITIKYPNKVDHDTVDKDKIIITDKDGNPIKDKDGKPLTGNDFTGPDADGKYTAKVPEGFEGEIKVEVPAGSYQDKDGNDGLAGNGGNTTVDTTPPQVKVDIDNKGNITLKYPDDVDHTTVDKGQITITDKDGKPITDKNGKPLTGNDFTGPDADGKYIAKVPEGFEGEVKVEVPAGSYKDKTGNDGLKGDGSNTTVDTTPPQVKVEIDNKGNITLTYPDDVDPDSIDKDKIIITDKDGNPIKDKDGKPLTGNDFTGPDADGKYTAKVPEGFEGEVKVEVPAGSYQDKDGNDGKGDSDTSPVDTKAATVSVDGYEDNVEGGIKGNVASGQSTNDNKPVISGTATNAKTVDVYIDGTLVGTATVNPDGTWTLPELTTPLLEGSHTITAKAKNGAGKEVGSNEYTVTVDTVVDAGSPEIVTDLDGNSTITTTVPKDVDNDGIKVIDPKTGAEIPGLTVKGPDADGKVEIIGKIPAGVDPELKVTDKVGNETTEAVTDNTPAATVSVDGYEDNVEGGIKGNVASGQSTNDNKPVISGTATNAKTVDVYIDGTLVGTATVNPDGTWTLPELTTPLLEGSHTITAKAKNGAGKEVGSNEYTVTVDTVVDAGSPEIVTDLDGNSTITTTVPKDVDNDGIKVIDPKTGAEIPGLTVKGPDADGKVEIIGKIPAGVDPELKVTDKVGNETTEAVTDNTPAATVSVDGYEDNVEGGIKGNVASGQSTNDNKPVISGTATNAKTVDVYIDGTLVGTATVNPDGTWTLPELTTPLLEGSHTITAKAKNGAGKEVGSNEYTVTVDTKVDAGKPHIEIDKDGNVTITTTVDPDDVIKIEIVDKDGHPILDQVTGEPLVGTADPITGEVKIEGQLPPEITTPELKVTDKVGNTTTVPTPFILEDEAFVGEIVAGSETAKYILNNPSATFDQKTGKYTLLTANGSVVLDQATGEYTYTPNDDFSGRDAFTVSVSDENGTKEIIVPILVTAVADTPLVPKSEMGFDVGELQLNKYVWKGIKGKMTIGGKEFNFDDLTNGGSGSVGDGINPEVLKNGIHALFTNKDVAGQRKPSESGLTTSLEVPDKSLAISTVVYIEGLVYLEAGKTYTYTGKADDTAMIVIGDGANGKSQYVSWKGVGAGSHTNTFTVDESGFYTFDLYVYNQSGQGDYNFKVTEEGGSDVKYYPSPEAIGKELPDYATLDPKMKEKDEYGNGYYGMKYGYQGSETEQIILENINVALADLDGSEQLSVIFTSAGFLSGTELLYKIKHADGSFSDGKATVNSAGQIIIDGIGKNIVGYQEFVLKLPEGVQEGSIDINMVVKSTETSNGDSQENGFDFKVEVLSPSKTVYANSGDDIISTGTTGHDTVVYDLLSKFETDKLGGHGVDTWIDFGVGNPATDTNADVIKFSNDFFKGLTLNDLVNDDVATVGKFITIEYDADKNTATITVDRDGDGTTYTPGTLLHLTNQDTAITLDQLLENNQIIIG